jgi:hypothetical protein
MEPWKRTLALIVCAQVSREVSPSDARYRHQTRRIASLFHHHQPYSDHKASLQGLGLQVPAAGGGGERDAPQHKATMFIGVHGALGAPQQQGRGCPPEKAQAPTLSGQP